MGRCNALRKAQVQLPFRCATTHPRGLGRGKTMPRTRTQRIVFSILMAFAMVYGMELYNPVLLAGGLRTELFAAPLAFKLPPAGELVAIWLQTVALNFPMALLWQLFVAGPAVRTVVRAMGQPRADVQLIRRVPDVVRCAPQ